MKWILALVLCSGIVAAADSDLSTLKVGDRTPSMHIDGWLNATGMKKTWKKVTVVCLFKAVEKNQESLQDLFSSMTEFAKENRDTVFFFAGTDNSLGEFNNLFALKDRMPHYPVAFGKELLKDFGVKAGPCLFILVDGKIAWIGAPGADFEAEVAKLVK